MCIYMHVWGMEFNLLPLELMQMILPGWRFCWAPPILLRGVTTRLLDYFTIDCD